MIKKSFYIIFNTFLALILLIILLEIFLRNYGQNLFLNSKAPPYIHIDHIKNNKKINRSNFIDNNGIRYSEEKLINNYLEFINTENMYTNNCKILFLGDSYLHGDGIDLKKTYPYLLKQKYKNRCKIFSIGFNGYSSYDLIEYFNKNLKNLNLDKIILNISYNDLVLNNTSKGDLQDKQKIKFESLLLNDLLFVNFSEKNKIRAKYIFSFLFNNVFESGRFIYGSLKPILSFIADKKLENKKDLIQINGYSKIDELNKSFFTASFNQWSLIVEDFNHNNNNKIIYFLSPLDKNELKYFDKIEEYFIKKKINYIFCKERYLDFNGLNFERKYWANLANSHGGSEYHLQYYKCFDEKFMKNYELN